MSTNLRKATTADLKTGTTLYTNEGYRFKLVTKIGGAWETRGMDGQGNSKVIFESEVQFYFVAN